MNISFSVLKNVTFASVLMLQTNVQAFPIGTQSDCYNIESSCTVDSVLSPDEDRKQFNENVISVNNKGFLDIFLIQESINKALEMAVDEKILIIEDKSLKQKREFKPIYPINWGDRSKNRIALTFDDGFEYSSAVKVLDALEKEKLSCTFFVTGQAVKRHPGLWKRAVKNGNQICNHTNSHVYLENLSNEQIKTEIQDWENAVADVLGKEYLERMKLEFPFFRLPYGSGGKSLRIMEVISDAKYIPIGWSDETVSTVLNNYDLKRTPVEKVVKRITDHITDNTQRGSIILLHFNSYDTYNIGDIIKGLEEKGLLISTVSEVLEDIY